jgi:Asp/Glu/hydantoin racemase
LAGSAPPFTLGVLMLDTRFPRPPGDIGNPASFDYPVLFRTLPGASVARIVTSQPLPDVITVEFVNAARELIAEGATAITTSCGFLSPLQHELQRALPVPVITSSLWMLPQLRRQYGPAARFGIITFDAQRVSPHHIPDEGPIVIEGLRPGDHLREVIAGNLETLDLVRAEAGVAAAARRLMARSPALEAVVLECTNLPPYRQKISEICDCKIIDIHDAIKSFAIYR